MALSLVFPPTNASVYRVTPANTTIVNMYRYLNVRFFFSLPFLHYLNPSMLVFRISGSKTSEEQYTKYDEDGLERRGKEKELSFNSILLVLGNHSKSSIYSQSRNYNIFRYFCL